MTRIRILVEPFFKQFTATAFDEVGMLCQSKGGTKAQAITRVKEKVLLDTEGEVTFEVSELTEE